MEKPVSVQPTAEKPPCDAAGCTPSGCSLNLLGVGRCGNVVAVGGDRELKRRLLEMGLCNGVAVECVRRAPLGDPIEFKLRGYNLSLRGEQAKFVQINIK